MQFTRIRRASFGLLAGSVAVASFVGSQEAAARGSGIRVVDCSIVSGQADVEQNQFLSIVFNSPVDPATVNPAIFQIRQRNASLSTAEKSMYANARHILISELAVSWNVDDTEAEARVDKALGLLPN